MENNILIYTTKDGNIDVKLEQETVWLNVEKIAELYGKDRSNIQRHIKHIYEEEELDKDSTCAFFAQVQKEGSRNITRQIPYYNLDVILSVGYRVSSKTATQFRKWATSVLHKYIVDGYTLNERLLKEKVEKLSLLQNAFNLLNRSITNQAENLDEAQQISKLMSDFSVGLNLLDDFDNQRLDNKGNTKKEVVYISVDEFLDVIQKMKTEFTSEIFGNPKDDSFSSSVNQIYQTFNSKDCYPSIEEKAVNLLYFIVKNHSFSDGNKRIGANCFLYFLKKNNLLYKADKPIIDNATLATITLLIAESKPEEKETVKQIAISILNRV